MKKLGFKSLISIILILSLMIPTVIFASTNTDVTIKNVYFQDENGNMVFVDYARAIQDAMDGDYILYNAIKEYVGIAEEKGRPLFIETNTGLILDYKTALIDNLFRFEDIIGNSKYQVAGPIAYTHILKKVDGVARIVEVEEEEDEEAVDIVRIDPVDGIIVEIGTSLEVAISRLPKRTTILDSIGRIHTVDLYWTIKDYNPNVEGDYTAIGTFELPEGIENNRGLDLEVRTTVTVEKTEEEEEFPEEVESVTVGKSSITEKTYANINIMPEYVDKVEGVYVDGSPATQIEDAPFQWRIQVADGTNSDDLKGKIRVELVDAPVKDPLIRATFHPHSMLPTFGYVTVVVENLEDASKFSVVYHLSDNEDGTQNIVETTIFNIGEQAGLIFYDSNQYDTVDIKIYDVEENLIYTFYDVHLVRVN
ncbi:hypothetical protein [Tepidimicrobium xylanilyticum]|uniref:Ig-like domain (Group 4) n=1 Tax=Tepidimicrobium xylanilyticum TaxID=1123352 RepID=A0A1H2Q9D0_9FIRM|nr:hypothetical protein [Tepidimicrobium xylanilyticum]SDW03695.1 hypothetical protein SAMN05660923_00090 [Tepidimicrobium xylanilyticum]